jgi:hypothetical protein
MLIFVYNHIIRYTNHAKIPDKFKKCHNLVVIYYL